MKCFCKMFTGFALLICIFVNLSPTQGQKNADEQIPVYSYRQLGPYRLLYDAPAEFKEFKVLVVRFKNNVNAYNAKLNQDGNLDIIGELSTTQRRYRFVNSIIGVEEKRLRRLTFNTENIKGISYSFEGRFPYPPRFDENIGHFIGLEGILIKYRGDKKIAEANLKLGYYVFE